MGRKEENIKKAQTLLHQKERIRNIGTAAHIDHGKCVTFETRIWVNGRWIRAGDLWAKYADRPPVPNKFGADVRDVRSESLWTQSLDLRSGGMEFAQLTNVWRLRSTEPLVEVESRDGRRIRTTSEHPFVVASGVKLDYREARSLRKGDVLVVPRKLPSRTDNEEDWAAFEEAMIQRLAADPRFRFHLQTEAQERLGIQGLVDGNELLQVAKTFRMPLASLYPKIEEISLRYPRPGGRMPRQISLPTRLELERFMWLVGLLDGDGTVEKARSAVSATSVSEEFLDELQLLLLRFGVRSILMRKRGKNTVYISGRKNLTRMPQFSDPEKAELQKRLELKSGTSYVVDLLPVDWKRLAPNDWKSRFYSTARQQPSAQSLLTMDDVDLSSADVFLSEELAFVEVKAVRTSAAEWVYDFSVPGPQNFVAEGLV